MDPVLANTLLPSDDINHPSPSFILPQQGPLDEVPISFDDLFSNDDFLRILDSGVNLSPFSPHDVPPQGGTFPQDVVRPFPQIAGFNALPQSALDTFDGTYAPLSHPTASSLADSSSAALDAGEQLSLFGTQNISIQSGPVLALAPVPGSSSPSSSSLNLMNPVSVAPTFGWPTGALSPVRAWDATVPSMARATTATASVRAEPKQVPVPRCSCYRRQPLVRIDDAIEWVRPDVMKMVLHFNFSWNAEAEAHSSWEPHDA